MFKKLQVPKILNDNWYGWLEVEVILLFHQELFDIEFQGYIKSEDYSQLLPCAQRAKHMYPWREQSDAMMRYCETLPSVDCS